MSLRWRYGGAAAILVAALVALAIVSSAGLTDGTALAVFVGLPGLALVLVEVAKRAAWDGSRGRCADCGTEVRSYRRYCEDCEPVRTGGGDGF